MTNLSEFLSLDKSKKRIKRENFLRKRSIMQEEIKINKKYSRRNDQNGDQKRDRKEDKNEEDYVLRRLLLSGVKPAFLSEHRIKVNNKDDEVKIITVSRKSGNGVAKFIVPLTISKSLEEDILSLRKRWNFNLIGRILGYLQPWQRRENNDHFVRWYVNSPSGRKILLWCEAFSRETMDPKGLERRCSEIQDVFSKEGKYLVSFEVKSNETRYLMCTNNRSRVSETSFDLNQKEFLLAVSASSLLFSFLLFYYM